MEKIKGFVKIDRDVFASDLWRKDAEPFCKRAAYIDLLRRVNYGDVTKKIDGKEVTIHAGEAFVAVRVLAEDWHWHRCKVHRFLKELEEDGRIKIETRAYGTIISTIQSESARDAIRDAKRDAKRDAIRDTLRDAKRDAKSRTTSGLRGFRETQSETQSETLFETPCETQNETQSETTIRRNSIRQETEEDSQKTPKPPLRIYPPGMENFSTTVVAPFGWAEDGHPNAPYGLRSNGIPVVPPGYKFKRQ